jgi:glutamine cyclotransferase
MRFRLKAYILTFCLLLIFITSMACLNSPSFDSNLSPQSSISSPAPVSYTYKIVRTYPHDREAYTEGLAYSDGILYEGSGLNGKSSIRKVELQTGKVLQIHNVPAGFFGEGVTIYKDRLIELTWKSHTGFVYNKDNFELLQNFSYTTEGWGITHDGRRLIMSDGTSTLYFLDPDTFQTIGSIEVRDGKTPVRNINELEYIDGRIYANIWVTDKIAIIDPDNGLVTGWIDLSGILRGYNSTPPENTLNGIAYDSSNNRLFVTGKFWPYLFEIKTERP